MHSYKGETMPLKRQRTAAERSYVAKATRRRRRILQSRILFHLKGKFSSLRTLA